MDEFFFPRAGNIRYQCTLSLPPESIRKLYSFQRAEKRCIGNEWVNAWTEAVVQRRSVKKMFLEIL